MELIADFLLAAGAVAAAFYCFVLGRRLKKFNSLEQGVGGAVAVLSAQVDELKETLEAAQGTAATSAKKLDDLNARADEASKRLELQIASLHDIPEKEEKNLSVTTREVTTTANAEPMFIRHVSGAPQ